MTRSSLIASIDLSKTKLLSRINRFSVPHMSQRSRLSGEIEALESRMHKPKVDVRRHSFAFFFGVVFSAPLTVARWTLGGTENANA